MMRFRINFTLPGDTVWGDVEDSVVVTGATIEEIQKAAKVELDKRGGENPWSQEL